jgi:hypothetical protein
LIDDRTVSVSVVEGEVLVDVQMEELLDELLSEKSESCSEPLSIRRGRFSLGNMLRFRCLRGRRDTVLRSVAIVAGGGTASHSGSGVQVNVGRFCVCKSRACCEGVIIRQIPALRNCMVCPNRAAVSAEKEANSIGEGRGATCDWLVCPMMEDGCGCEGT